jgi:Cupin
VDAGIEVVKIPPVMAGAGGRRRRGPRHEIEPEVIDLAGTLDAAGSVDDLVVGGRVLLNPAGRALLLQALPPVGHVRAADAGSTRLRVITGQLVDELTGRRLGSDFVVRQYSQCCSSRS